MGLYSGLLVFSFVVVLVGVLCSAITDNEK